ncbi:ERMES complex Ca(2+)-binding regulatory GTPase gem1 [Ceratobasidium sp. 414]|nr:ERMES complex Ca(2+)-binding regulatory GTPase gem1 [Ceratobasidium sp. 414]
MQYVPLLFGSSVCKGEDQHETDLSRKCRRGNASIHSLPRVSLPTSVHCLSSPPLVLPPLILRWDAPRQGVGKSTIVTSLIKEEYVDNVQHVVPEVTIPPEVTPENVTTYIVDSSGRAQVPVILVGNKIDLRGGEVSNEDLENEVAPIMEEFKEVETCVECSARIPTNIAGIIFFAQKAVLHPTAPLYDSREHVSINLSSRGVAPIWTGSTLKPAAVDALRRIFRLCDTNKDGVLDTHELNEFQQTCFKSPLQPPEVEGIKNILRGYDPSMLRPIPSPPHPSPHSSPHSSPRDSPRDSPPSTLPMEEGVTEDGFLYLHTEFIRRARVETTWIVLRQFGYAEDLKLTEEWLAPKFDVPQDCSVELSPQGYQFFTDIFQIFDKDQDGALRPEELDNLFNTSPGNPWVADDDEGVDGTITLQHWLAKWSMTTLLDHKKTLAYLAYLGYNTGPATSALKITKPRRAERRKGRVTRNVFLCYVVGAAGSGKSSILNCFRELGGGGVGGNVTGKENAKGKGKGGLDEVGPYRPTEKVLSVVGAVELKGAEKYLVMQEFGSKSEADMLRDAKIMDLADVIIYVHDSSDTNSFSYISNLRQQYNLDHIPSMFVATKSDLDLAQQRHEVQPDVYCRRLGLQGPYAVSIKNPQIANLFPEIVSTAINPLNAIPGGAERTSATLARRKVALGITVTLAGLMVAYRAFLRPIGYGSGWWSNWYGMDVSLISKIKEYTKRFERPNAQVRLATEDSKMAASGIEPETLCERDVKQIS